MKYLVLLADTDEGDQAWNDATEEVQAEFMAAHDAFSQAITERGRIVAGEALAGPRDATTLRHVEGKPTWTDGPYAEAVEHLGGFYLVDVPDLDTVMQAATLLPPYAIEIRPAIDLE